MSAFQRRQIQAAMDGEPDPNPSSTIPWTDERVEVAKRMWGDGHTGAEIARHLKGVTRSAVVAKMDRLGLVGTGEVRAEPSAPAARGIAASTSLDASGQVKGRPRRARTRQSAPDALPAATPAPAPAKQAKSRPAKRERKACRIAAVPPGFAVSLLEHREPAQKGLASAMAERDSGHAIMDLPLSQCRWPVNDAVFGETHLFCGEKNAPGKMYCPRHAARAVEPTTKRKGGDA